MSKPKTPKFHATIVSDGLRPPAWMSLFDVALIETVLQDAARSGVALSYSETLFHLGHNFSRPKMRALCAALDEVDARAQRKGEPGLAILVVRASDGLPGAGWWTNRQSYKGPWDGPQAQAYIRKKQNEVFKFWDRPKTRKARKV